MAEWLDLFHGPLLAARRSHGFGCLGSWTDRDDPDVFVWIATYDGPLTWDDADRRYYASAERAAIAPSPGSLLEEILGTRVLLPTGPAA